MSRELGDKIKSQIDEILKKFPEQRGLDPARIETKFWEKLHQKLPGILSLLFFEVLFEIAKEELQDLGRSQPCKFFSTDSEFCKKGKRWGPACFTTCEDYEPKGKRHE